MRRNARKCYPLGGVDFPRVTSRLSSRSLTMYQNIPSYTMVFTWVTLNFNFWVICIAENRIRKVDTRYTEHGIAVKECRQDHQITGTADNRNLRRPILYREHKHQTRPPEHRKCGTWNPTVVSTASAAEHQTTSGVEAEYLDYDYSLFFAFFLQIIHYSFQIFP